MSKLHFRNFCAVLNYLQEEALYGGYETMSKYDRELRQTYQNIASLINCEPEEVALVENATVAWNMAFSSIEFRKGDVILTSEVEYGSNFVNYLKAKKEKGVIVQVIPPDANGAVDVEALEAMISPAVRLISITHIPTNGGLINPVAAIGEIAAKHGILYLVDSCQSVGQMPMDVQKIQCSFLTATGPKFLRGPRGTGFLYVSKAVMDQLNPPFLDHHAAQWIDAEHYTMHPAAQRFENWESSRALQMGLSEAVAYANQLGVENTWMRIQQLADYTREELAKIPDIEVLDMGKQKCGIVTFRKQGTPAPMLHQYLEKNAINTSVVARASTLLDMQRRHLDSINRASVHYYNTFEEIDRLTAVLRALPA